MSPDLIALKAPPIPDKILGSAPNDPAIDDNQPTKSPEESDDNADETL